MDNSIMDDWIEIEERLEKLYESYDHPTRLLLRYFIGPRLSDIKNMLEETAPKKVKPI